MKKILLAGSALAATSLIAGSAFAQVKVNAFGNVGYRLNDLNQATGATYPGTGTNQDGFTTDFEISFSAAKDTKIGKAGFYVEMDADAAGVDESNIWFEGSWGKVLLGSQDGVVNDFSINGTAVAVDGMSSDTIATGSANSATKALNWGGTGDLAAGDAAKISYLTPSMGGFQAGFSITPNNGTTNANYQLGAGYNGKAGGVDIGVSVAYASQSPSGVDHDGYSFGASVGMSGFTVLVGYLSDEKDGAATGVKKTGWNLGASYAMGDTTVSALYGAGKTVDNSKTDATGKTNKNSEFGFGVSHTLGEGVSVTLGAVSGTTKISGSSDLDYKGAALEVKTSW